MKTTEGMRPLWSALKNTESLPEMSLGRRRCFRQRRRTLVFRKMGEIHKVSAVRSHTTLVLMVH